MFIDVLEHENSTVTGGKSVAEDAANHDGQEPKTDYKALYEATLKERDAAKEKSDKYEAENKGYKEKEEEQAKAEREKLPVEEQIKLALAEKERELSEYRQKWVRSELEKAFSKNGYEETDYKDVVGFLISGFTASKEDKSDISLDLAMKIIAFADNAKQKAIETSRNEAIKDGAFLPKASEEHARKSAFAQYQEEQYKLRHPELSKK